MGIRFLVITRPFFHQLDWNFLWELMKPLFIDCWWAINVICWVSDLDFWALIGGQKGVADTPVPKVLSLKTQPKRWPSGGPFGVSYYIEIMLSKFSALNPPLLIQAILNPFSYSARLKNTYVCLYTINGSQKGLKKQFIK